MDGIAGPGAARRRGPDRVDAAVAAAVAVLQVVGALATAVRDAGEPRLRWWGALLLVASGAALVLARRAPVATAAVIGVLTAWYGIAPQPDPPIYLAGAVALYWVGARCARRVAAAVALLALPTSVVVVVATKDSGVAAWWAAMAPVAVGLALGIRSREREERADQQRREDLEHAVEGERRRIARELHDVVAHHVTLGVVQAEAAAAELGDREPAAVAAFDEVAATGRGALVELRRLLQVLRDDGAQADREPVPDLTRLPELVEHGRAAGLTVQLAVTGAERPVDDGVALTTYRIVQEAVTNVVRHAPGATVRVELAWARDRLRVSVADDGGERRAVGPGASSGWAGAGRGLRGVQERVEMVAGRVEVGPQPGGGFVVEAELPLRPATVGS